MSGVPPLRDPDSVADFTFDGVVFIGGRNALGSDWSNPIIAEVLHRPSDNKVR
jgi:hypothetical protein